MLFISNIFIFLFLPFVLFGFFYIARKNHARAILWLVFASLFFYGWWNPKFIILLLTSIVLNYHIGCLIVKTRHKKYLLILGVTLNLSILFLFKYLNFFISTLNHFSTETIATLHIILPLGISFFTFTQIAFLVDVYRGIAAEYRFSHYLLFVTYFPHLIAGPILHHKQMMPQFNQSETYRLNADNIAIGLSIFVMGFAKKILLADSFGEYTSSVFNAVHLGTHPNVVMAWTGALAYTFELYFDFSGYSDMAIGLSRLFGIRLPINFYSPYKSFNMIDFWRRWHISLSQFLRDYLYIPLGGNRLGKARRYRNLFITMLLGGLWHGANWTYVVWGALHGLFLMINHAWLFIVEKCHLSFLKKSAFFKAFSLLLTFTAIVIAWVFFRAETLSNAMTVLKGMIGCYGVGILPFKSVMPIALGFFLVWCCPNSAQLFEKVGYSVNQPIAIRAARFAWKTSFVWAFLMTFLGVLSIAKQFGTTTLSPFLYFQF